MIGKVISHYKILEELGRGGMGVVYKAHDAKLDRFVALKFLPEQISTSEQDKERFLQEARAASAINHPNICTIYDIKEFEGREFIVMEYVEGETLSQKIKDKPLKLKDAVEYAIQIGEALQAAHDKDVVHRDIKSENIMITANNQVKVMDFGLAKLKGTLKLTKTGSTVGTLAYMAPEQLQGEEVDARSDIFSFGVVLFEMLTGELPFQGEYESALMYSILNDEPQSIERLRPDAPVEFSNVITKALDKDPDLRYQVSKGMVADLKRVKKDTDSVSRTQVSGVKQEIPPKRMSRKQILLGFATAVVLISVIAAILFILPRRKSIDSLAILPFVNTTGQEDTEWLSDGIPESIIASLQKIPNLRVTSFQSVLRQYEDEVPAVGDVRRDFNVKSVVLGKMTLRGDDVTVNIEIVDTRDNSVILTQQYIEKIANLFDVQAKIGRDITEKLSLELTEDVERKVFPIHPPDFEAYQNYLRG